MWHLETSGTISKVFNASRCSTLCAMAFTNNGTLENKRTHGGESRDILHIYSDRTDKNIRHYFFNAQ